MNWHFAVCACACLNGANSLSKLNQTHAAIFEL